MGELRDAVKVTISAAIPALTVYDTVPDDVILPAVMVRPTTTTYGHTVGDPDDTYGFDLYVLVSRAEIGLGQDALDGYLSSAGDDSIRWAIQRSKDLGIPGPASVRARVTGMSDYGAQFEAASVEHVGAILRMLVTIRGPR